MFQGERRCSSRSPAHAQLCLPIVWSVLVAAAAADDSVFTSQTHRFSIKAPSPNWSQKIAPKENLDWLASSPTGAKSIFVAVMDQPAADFGNPDFQRGFENGFLKPANGTKTKGTATLVDGRPAYRFVAEMPALGKKVSVVVLGVASHGRAYAISGQSSVGDADIDAEINAGINSFHLLDPPDPPAAPLAAQYQAEKVGEAVGRILGVIVLVVVVVLLGKKIFTG